MNRDILQEKVDACGIKFFVEDKGVGVARAYLYILRNDLHEHPFGLMEDVYVDEKLRGQGLGRDLVKRVIAEARAQDCYKLICTSRYGKEDSVHALYVRLGFADHGKEFRIDF